MLKKNRLYKYFLILMLFVFIPESVLAQRSLSDLSGLYECYRISAVKGLNGIDPYFILKIKILGDSFISAKQIGCLDRNGIHGKCVLRHDTLYLYSVDTLRAKLLVQNNGDELRLIYKSASPKEDDSLSTGVYYQMEGYNERGELNKYRKLNKLYTATKPFTDYEWFGQDTVGNITFHYHVRQEIDMGKEGKEYVYIPYVKGTTYMYDDNDKPLRVPRYLYHRLLCGRWHYGKKTGTWRYYDGQGKVVRIEEY